MSAPELSAAEAATVARFEAGEAAPESWTGSQVAVDLRMAADLLEWDGWVQGVYVSDEGCRCVMGAVTHALGGSYGEASVPAENHLRRDLVFATLEKSIGIPRWTLDCWNDEEERTAAEVIAALRAAADKADQA